MLLYFVGLLDRDYIARVPIL
uniref:Uncharacterized protein n=1 Tax=Arundo donax TaxID=35708 RepID=A0A0A9HJ99_ARUDO